VREGGRTVGAGVVAKSSSRFVRGQPVRGRRAAGHGLPIAAAPRAPPRSLRETECKATYPDPPEAYDYKLIDQSALEIVDNGQAHRRRRPRAGAAADPHPAFRHPALAARDKTSRDQFEMRTHLRLMDIIDPTDKTVDALMKLDLLPGSTSRSRSVRKARQRPGPGLRGEP